MSQESQKTERKKWRAAPSPSASSADRERNQPWELMLAGDFNEKHTELLESLLEVPTNSRGTIYFDSNGGSVYTSLSLMCLIQLRRLNVTGVVLGECSSAALLPFAACRRRFVTPYSTLLFHAMKWESEENVRIHEAAEWARHFQEVERSYDQLLAQLFGVDLKILNDWTVPGRFVTGPELAAAGMAELLDPLDPLAWKQVSPSA